ncbi:hypothetical protein AB6735_26175 [Mucilaginibacter sp. RCC_168]|uniref:hypothetical protein n=1 Tax=Mucilaginibacter sp. RCC_168 TaxID=3239221 RepID=UPI003525E6CA
MKRPKRIILVIVLSTLMLSWTSFQKAIFDLPALKNKNIDQVTKALGKPSEELKPTKLEVENHITGLKFFTKGKYVLTVEYYADSKKVESYFLGEKDIVANYKPLIAIGNLVNSLDYYIEPVRAHKDHAKFTGINITPK